MESTIKLNLVAPGTPIPTNQFDLYWINTAKMLQKNNVLREK
jgi:hypothetical protein